MAAQVTFILGLHNHQPVGNFDHVFEEAYRTAYLPFLRVLRDYPDIPFSLHNSGVLWNWLLEKHPEYVELVAGMVGRGQVELMSGGYYEPILTVIPERDRRGQLERMRRFLEERFGRPPRGCWLTERIWDPHLPRILADAGLEYVIVDDSHFKSTGFSSRRMRGYFLTEEDGAYIRIFPIDKRLRYLIPFKDPAETIRYLRSVADEEGGGNRVAVLADDGEKFGLWPGTASLCYDERWLARFCDALRENADWIEISTFSRIIDRCAPLGIVYLPTASYSEMMEWALPIEAQRIYHAAAATLAADGAFEEPAEILRGGFWRNFLVKYEESNWMHKRMLLASSLAEEYRRAVGEDERWLRAVDHLYQSQCNCAYWHGLFGGLYLPHLRSAVFSHLIDAERVLEPGVLGDTVMPNVVTGDVDGDGVTEIAVTTGAARAFFKVRGATLREFDIREPALNLTDTLTRREELYHRRIAELNAAPANDGAAVSIHELHTAKERHLERYLVYDGYLRSSLLDHFLGSSADLDSFSRASSAEAGDFIAGTYSFDVERSDGEARVIFERTGSVRTPHGTVAVAVTKRVLFRAGSAGMDVHYVIRPVGAGLACRFAVESVFSLLAGNAPDRYFSFPDRTLAEPRLASSGAEETVGSCSMIDEWLNVAVGFRFDPPVLLWRFPIETVSNSESGFERVYQGSAVVPVWTLELGENDEAAVRIGIDVRAARRKDS